jgi:hypothetical protein
VTCPRLEESAQRRVLLRSCLAWRLPEPGPGHNARAGPSRFSRRGLASPRARRSFLEPPARSMVWPMSPGAMACGWGVLCSLDAPDAWRRQPFNLPVDRDGCRANERRAMTTAHYAVDGSRRGCSSTRGCRGVVARAPGGGRLGSKLVQLAFALQLPDRLESRLGRRPSTMAADRRRAPASGGWISGSRSQRRGVGPYSPVDPGMSWWRCRELRAGGGQRKAEQVAAPLR